MMKKIVMIAAALLCAASAMQGSVTVGELRVNHLSQPAGIDSERPVFSWIATSDRRGDGQSAYEIEVKNAGGTVVWATGKVPGDVSTGVPYQGKALAPASRYSWTVRVWNKRGEGSKTASSTFVTGMRGSSWQAQWIEPQPADSAACHAAPCPVMRHEFTVSKPVKSAIAYVTSHGMNEVYLNGAKVGNYHYAPGWTSYGKRLQYYTHDVTSMVHKGRNAFGLMLGKGWMMSSLGWYSNYVYKNISSTVGALAQIVITYTDGTQQVVTTDGTWRYATAQVQESTIYDGETVDARKALPGWNTAGYDDSAWKPVHVASYDNGNLIACENEPVVTRQLMKPVKVLTTPKGEKVIDFGQNMVGREIVTLKGKPGQVVTIKHAEVLDEKGNFYTHNLRSAKATSTYVLSGGVDKFEPTFTFYGFRYLKVEGLEGELNPADYQVAVCYSGFDDNGSFTCSNDTVNQLQSNLRWGMHGNYLDVPTDCPQRDERLGWMGDAQVFFRTATFNGRVQNFFTKWLKDVAADQRADGSVQDVTPNVLTRSNWGHTGWADAATIIPWQHYMAYGDKQVLADQYESMRKWVDFMASEAHDYLWDKGWHYGDWLFYSKPNDPDGTSAVTSKRLIQQVFFAHSADIVSQAAAVLGNMTDAARYAQLRDKARQAFCDAYLTKRGNLMSDTQTAYVLALHFDMLPADVRPYAARRLAELVKQYGHITTGFLGTPYICDVLTQNGYDSLAYKLLLHKGYPGWLYPVTMGATTIWERWNSMMPDHTIPDNGMNSFNHYSYGAIGDWLYRDAVGIQETSPGFKTIRVRPHLGGGFTHMSAKQGTPYGTVSASWKIEGGAVLLDVEIPFNTTAVVDVPAHEGATITCDGKQAKPDSQADGYASFHLGSGRYHFAVAR